MSLFLAGIIALVGANTDLECESVERILNLIDFIYLSNMLVTVIVVSNLKVRYEKCTNGNF